MMVCCILLNQTNNKQVRPILESVFGLIPNPDSAVECQADSLATIIKTTGFQNVKASRIKKFSQKWIEGFDDMENTYENKEPEKNEEQSTSARPNNTNSDSRNIGYSFPIEYSRDTLNPLLKQTIKRIVSIDSQYRDDKSSLSTDFTFNLSDPLRDVVNLKLYSIQIPYTWWTINSNFGSNFFYLKGNSPGINDGNHDYKFEIPVGNYTAPDLITAVNTAINKFKIE
jgi:hypothetical protein